MKRARALNPNEYRRTLNFLSQKRPKSQLLDPHAPARRVHRRLGPGPELGTDGALAERVQMTVACQEWRSTRHLQPEDLQGEDTVLLKDPRGSESSAVAAESSTARFRPAGKPPQHFPVDSEHGRTELHRCLASSQQPQRLGSLAETRNRARARTKKERRQAGGEQLINWNRISVTVQFRQFIHEILKRNASCSANSVA